MTTKKQTILDLVEKYTAENHINNLPGDNPNKPKFDKATDSVPYAGRVYDHSEVVAAVDATLDFWLTLDYCLMNCW